MFRNFGHRIGNRALAEIAIFLYKASRADSTRKTYAVGQRHWIRFQNLHPRITFFSFATISPDFLALLLYFFVDYLVSPQR